MRSKRFLELTVSAEVSGLTKAQRHQQVNGLWTKFRLEDIAQVNRVFQELTEFLMKRVAVADEFREKVKDIPLFKE